MSEAPRTTQGYVTDVDYTWGAYPQQAPIQVTLAAAFNGLALTAPDAPYVYADLGCGNGLSLNLLASANPQSRFIGIDLNERHIANAQAFATAAGIRNVEFHAKDFAGAAEADLPMLDFVAMHGVYTWIPQEARAAILYLLRQRLKPDGLVYLAYNALPGWAALEPMRQMMLTYAATTGGTTIDKAAHALAILRALHEQQAPFFQANNAATQMLDQLLKLPPSYVAHEFLNEAWEPLYFTRMAREMGLIGCTFAGCLPLLANFADLQTTPGLRAVMGQAGDRVLEESLKDLVLNTRFRIDLFTRGEAIAHRTINWDWLMARRVTRTADLETFRPEIRLGSTTFKLTAPVFAAVLDAVGEGTPTLAELRAATTGLEPDQAAWRKVVQTLFLAHQLDLAAGHAVPPSTTPPERLRLTLPANERVLRELAGRQETSVLASPVTGGLPTIPLTQAQLTLAALDGVAPGERASWLRARLAQLGRVVADRSGQPLTGKDEQEALAAALQHWETRTLPRLLRLGILEAA